MPKAITTLPVNTFVKDMGSLYNGVPIKWRIIDFNHANYPENTVTLVALIDKEFSVSRLYDTTKETTFLDIKTGEPDQGKTVGLLLDEFYLGLNEKLKLRVKDTVLKVGYASSYTSSRPPTKDIVRKTFLIGAKEYNYGSSTSLEPTVDQSYFSKMKDFNSPSLAEMFGFVGKPSSYKILSRDIAISSSYSYILDPGVIEYRYGRTIDSTPVVAGLLPIMNVSTTDLTVMDTPEADGTYLLNLVENKFLIEDGNDIKRYFKPADVITQEYSANLCTDYNSVFIYSQDFNTLKQSAVDSSSSTYLQSAYAPKDAYVGYNFAPTGNGIKKHIRRIILDQTQYSNAGRAMTVKVQVSTGSSENGVWTDVGGVYTLNNYMGISTIDLPASKPMEAWRIVPQTQDKVARWPISGLQMMELVDKTIVSPYQWETIGQKPVTKAIFDQYGMKDLNTVDMNAVAALTSTQPEVLCWTDDYAPTPLRYVHATAVAQGILLEMNSSISLAELNAWRLDATIAGTGILKVAYSVNEGATWTGATGDLSALTPLELNTKGFTAAQWNALTKAQLDAVSDQKKVRIALYLERQNTTDTLEVRGLLATEILYKATPSIESVRSQYEQVTQRQPKCQVSRDGINWIDVKLDELQSLSTLPIGTELRVKVILSGGIELHALGYAWG